MTKAPSDRTRVKRLPKRGAKKPERPTRVKKAARAKPRAAAKKKTATASSKKKSATKRLTRKKPR